MKPTVIGVAGGTASGKSTVAQGLARVLGARCLLLLHDRYYHTLPPAYRKAPATYNFDHPNALDTARLVRDLDALRQGRTVRVPSYDFASHVRQPEEDLLEPRPVIVVEGILVLQEPALRARMDHRIYVDTPDDVRFARRLRRDLQKRGRTEKDVLEQYERTVRPMHEAFVRPSRVHADVVLDGTEPVEALVQVVLQRLQPTP